MLPVASSIDNILPPPIVNTALPGAAVVHVPYDNVAPSVSNAEVNNNTKGSPTVTPQQEQAEQAASANARAFSAITSGAASAGAGVQATFIAQILAQDSSPPTQRLLLQYQKLVAMSNVKYKPSNAMKPEVEPAGAFGQILAQEKTAQPESPPVDTTPQATNDNQHQDMQETQQIMSIPLPTPQPTPSAQVSNAYAARANAIPTPSPTETPQPITEVA